MAIADILLIVWTIVSLAAAGCSARRWPAIRIWKAADRLYYPLAAIGVVLLFLANDANRALLGLVAKKSQMESAWAQHPNRRPQVVFGYGSVDLLAARFAWFEEVQRLGEICAASANPDCAIHQRHARLVASVFGNFTPRPATDEASERVRKESEYCRRGSQLLARYQQESTLPDATGTIRRGMAEIRQGRDEQVVADRIRTSLDEQTATLSQLTDTETRRFLALEASFASDLFGRFAWCAALDPSDLEALRALDQWSAEDRRRSREMSEVDRLITETKADDHPSAMQRVMKWLQLQMWPFVLILALAIKFGKAMAESRDGGPGLAQMARAAVGKLKLLSRSSGSRNNKGHTSGGDASPPSRIGGP